MPSIAAGIGQFAIIQSVAPSVGVDVTPVDVRDARRDRARHHGLRAVCQWRSDPDCEPVVCDSS